MFRGRNVPNVRNSSERLVAAHVQNALRTVPNGSSVRNVPNGNTVPGDLSPQPGSAQVPARRRVLRVAVGRAAHRADRRRVLGAGRPRRARAPAVAMPAVRLCFHVLSLVFCFGSRGICSVQYVRYIFRARPLFCIVFWCVLHCFLVCSPQLFGVAKAKTFMCF